MYGQTLKNSRLWIQCYVLYYHLKIIGMKDKRELVLFYIYEFTKTFLGVRAFIEALVSQVLKDSIIKSSSIREYLHDVIIEQRYKYLIQEGFLDKNLPKRKYLKFI